MSLLACALRLTLPSLLLIRSNVSQGPIAVRLAISGEAPALSAVTMSLFACARKLTVTVSRIRLNSSQGPIAVRLAISGRRRRCPR